MKSQINSFKEKKTEKTNPCFRGFGDSIKKKKNEVNDKKNIFKKLQNLSFSFSFWDKEKKLIFFTEKKKKSFF